MEKVIKILLFCFVISSVLAVKLNSEASNSSGTVDFDVKPLNIPHSKYQEVSLFGCHNTSRNVKKLEWGKSCARELSYGWQKSGDKRFFVAKYYLASPPVPANPKPDQRTTLGLLKPDNFKFKGKDPYEKVILDYNLLKPMFLKYVTIDYGSCKEKVDIIPINTSCPEFPYQNGEKKLASGIGVLENKDGKGKIFLPTQDMEGSNPLQCNVSILNDIQLDYQINFLVGEVITDHLNLTQQYRSDSDFEVALICAKRSEVDPLPSGCSP